MLGPGLTELPPPDGTALAFTNARVDVVPLADGRGAGVRAWPCAPWTPIARGSAPRGRVLADGSIGICGVRFELVPDAGMAGSA